MSLTIWDAILGTLAILSLVLAYVSEEYRIFAIIFAFVLFIILIISVQSFQLSSFQSNQKRFGEKLKIHESLIDIKSEIKELQKEVFKNGKNSRY